MTSPTTKQCFRTILAGRHHQGAVIRLIMDSADGARYVSPRANFVILAGASVALLSIALCLVFASVIFPDKEAIAWNISAFGYGPSKQAALTDFAPNEKTAKGFLERAGFTDTKIEIGELLVSQTDPPTPRVWEASQELTVRGDSYAFFSNLSNEASKLDASEKHVAASFPPIPFQAFLVWVGFLTVVLLSLSAAAVEFRRAETNTPPRGMHGFWLFIQSQMYAIAVIAAVTYVHLNALYARTAFEFVAVCIMCSLGFWLLRTRPYWNQSAFLTRAYVAYVAGAVAVALILTLSVVRGPA